MTEPINGEPIDEVATPSTAPAPTIDRVGVPWGLATFLVLAVFLVIFAVQNTQQVRLNFLGWSGRFPLVVIIISMVVASIVLDEILGAVLRRRRRRRLAEREELRRLRSISG